jgi:hypothetical protein
MDRDTAPSKVPKPMVVLFAIWVASQLYIYFASRGPEMWPNDQTRGVAMTVGDVLQFIYAFLIIALVAYGLLKKQRFVWMAAFVWQATQAGFALVSLSLLNYQLDDYPSFAGFPFYGIVLPLATAAVSVAILSLPTTRRWVRRS